MRHSVEINEVKNLVKNIFFVDEKTNKMYYISNVYSVKRDRETRLYVADSVALADMETGKNISVVDECGDKYNRFCSFKEADGETWSFVPCKGMSFKGSMKMVMKY